MKRKQTKKLKDNILAIEAEIILRDHGLNLKDFWRWMEGQTCPLIKGVPGVYRWDLERYIERKKNGVLPQWD